MSIISAPFTGRKRFCLCELLLCSIRKKNLLLSVFALQRKNLQTWQCDFCQEAGAHFLHGVHHFRVKCYLLHSFYSSVTFLPPFQALISSCFTPLSLFHTSSLLLIHHVFFPLASSSLASTRSFFSCFSQLSIFFLWIFLSPPLPSSFYF